MDNHNRSRDILLESLEDLMEKIKTNEEFPENGMPTAGDYDAFQERIDECLNCWYY